MKRTRSRYTCRECGQEHPRWGGRCESCGGWNTLIEEVRGSGGARAEGRSAGRPRPLMEVDVEECARIGSGIAEFDRVLGGGLVPGSAVLLGGDPGVGKSTLLLEVAARRAEAGVRPLYVTAEESEGQVAMRAERISTRPVGLMVMAEDRTERIVDVLMDEPPDLVVVDSIQTVRKSDLLSAAGSVAQVRESAAELIAAARSVGVPLILVGHVTKDGMIAGPRVLEHLVDVVLYFEGERESGVRILRATKNRFGPTGELALFSMGERGLAEPRRPGALFSGAAAGLPGTAVAAANEGSRVFLVEVQALTAPASFGPPRIRTNGVDPARASMLAAVLSRRGGLPLLDQDIHLNVAGGLRLQDPGSDLALCVALATSFLDRAAPRGAVAFGEVGLGGEVRPVRNEEARLREAGALGFECALTPVLSSSGREHGLQVAPLASVRDLLDLIR